MYKTPRGTFDILPEEQKYWRSVEARAAHIAHLYGYQRLDVPVFENADLFRRTVGKNTDIVQKEMYTFQDRGGDQVTLRPEGTAPVCRAYLEHGMQNRPQPVRLYYFCPVFRYERPQAGRYRQHHQFGIEAIGDAGPSVDAEVAGLAWHLLEELGLRNLLFLANSIGDSDCRPDYLVKLKAYYNEHMDNLCIECRSRYHSNPLRLLDCKRETCRPLGQAAPRSIDHLCARCGDHWKQFLRHMEVQEVPVTVDHRLVRGLDYYTRTVFEIQPFDGGSQSTICGGGRYDGLIQQLGGRPTPGTGFATGIERVVLNLKRQEAIVPDAYPTPIVITFIGDDAMEQSMRLANCLRSAKVATVLAPGSKSLKGQMRHASALGARYTLILGEDEVRQKTVVLRDMVNGEQETVATAQIVDRILSR